MKTQMKEKISDLWERAKAGWEKLTRPIEESPFYCEWAEDECSTARLLHHAEIELRKYGGCCLCANWNIHQSLPGKFCEGCDNKNKWRWHADPSGIPMEEDETP